MTGNLSRSVDWAGIASPLLETVISDQFSVFSNQFLEIGRQLDNGSSIGLITDD
jgi:hypothetical protein